MNLSPARPFDFETEFKDAMFAIGYHGDGCGAELVIGWRNLVKTLEAQVLGEGADAADVAKFRDGIHNPDDWEWSYATPPQPYHYGELSFEAESITVYRVVPCAGR